MSLTPMPPAKVKCEVLLPYVAFTNGKDKGEPSNQNPSTPPPTYNLSVTGYARRAPAIKGTAPIPPLVRPNNMIGSDVPAKTLTFSIGLYATAVANNSF